MNEQATPTAQPARRWTAEEMERIEALIAGIESKQVASVPLGPQEAACDAALQAMARAEADARDAFSAFYLGLGEAQGGDGHVYLPADVAARVNAWVESTRAWEAAVDAAFLALPAPPARPPAVPRRTGARLRATLPAAFRVPTAEPARDLLAALFATRRWQANDAGTAIWAQLSDTRVQIELDDVAGFGPERAVQQIARHGASVAQTFLAMTGLWLEHNQDRPHETYLTAHASDLLRYQGRKETPRGGYHAEDALAKGRDVYLLSRISVPASEVATFEGGRRVVKTLSIGRLLSLESLHAEQTAEGGQVHSVVRFRYHPGKDVHDWICGDRTQYAALSGKLLTYHPVRQKFQILLGLCLAYHDRANRRNGLPARRIGLPALLKLAAIDIPTKRVAEFLVSIEDALNDLARDGVIAGARLEKPDGWADLLASRKTREVIARSVVSYPSLLAPKGEGGGTAAAD